MLLWLGLLLPFPWRFALPLRRPIIPSAAPSDAIREAEEIALKKGMQQGITAIVHLCRDLNVDKKSTIDRLKTEFSLTDKQAEEAVLKYWE